MTRSDFRLGKTIVGARGRDREVELARVVEWKKTRRRNVVVGCACAAVGVLLVIWTIFGVAGMVSETSGAAVDAEVWVPMVDILVEGSGGVGDGVREFVAKMERDFGDLGFAVEKAVLPLGKIREVDIYIVNRVEFYKMSLDRGTAVQAEDAERMMRYLDGAGVVAEYVDLRVEGKGYYK